MLNFDTYVTRHGEFGAQALIERMERYEGIRASAETPLSLEERWNRLIADDNRSVASRKRAPTTRKVAVYITYRDDPTVCHAKQGDGTVTRMIEKLARNQDNDAKPLEGENQMQRALQALINVDAGA